MRITIRLLLYLALATTTVANAQSRSDQVAALRAAVSGDLHIAIRTADGRASFVRSNGDLQPSDRRISRQAKAQAFIRLHGRLLGIDNWHQLRLLRSRTDSLGSTTLSYQQIVNDVPVFGARINVNFAANNTLRSVNGDFAPGLMLNTRPEITSAEAGSIALLRVAAAQPAAGLQARTPKLYVYRLPLRANHDGPAMLTWHVEITNARGIREFVVVNAANGKIVDQYQGVHHALDRRIYDGGFSPAFLVWAEGDPTPHGVDAIDDLIRYTADSYYFFANLTGNTFLSWDGEDGIMHAINNDPGVTCPNATWNGVSINFCNGTTGDDIVAHEWGHAYTESTHGLIYRWQSGALNESYSDIFGEVIDQLNADGDDTPDEQRSVGVCSTFGGTTPPGLEVLTPPAIAGDYNIAGAAFNPATADLSAALIAVEDGVGTSTDACEAITTPVSGAIALIDRGNCDFVDKVLNAQAAGAVGTVIANNAGEDLVFMGGSAAGINIPSVFISQSDGQVIRNASGVNVALTLGGATEESLRWLLGEDASGFGGAIRDLWMPQCYGDPGKVSDGQYFCDGAVDSGGVHTNSGVPNHAFALLVDGGTYNGVTVSALGLEKAVNIYWRAAFSYQTPTSDFADHADALETACNDLVGIPLDELSTLPQAGGQSDAVITTVDCDAVSAAIAATELRLEPIQCNFMTMLEGDAPDLCGPGTSPQEILGEDFDSGLNGWTAGQRELLNPATFSGPDWSISNELPAGRPGSAAYGPNLVLGNCSTDIESGIIYLQSPPVDLPVGTDTPRLAFDHAVMTEADYDGANLKLSVNGGPWQLVPGSAFTFNPYNGSLVVSDNPMGGEEAFHGTDEGTLTSMWGQSHVSLDGLAAGGDSIRLRFEVGMDGCNGVLGWFVDDVTVYSCAAEPDDDEDLIPNSADNCTQISNPDQTDTDDDGYGNLCDADLDNSGLVNLLDLLIFRAAFLTSSGDANWNADADLNADGIVNLLDLITFRSLFLSPPGPSGLL